jgi:mannose-1-phosphate guanylyltransferase/mannose-6-phosphate isomerase
LGQGSRRGRDEDGPFFRRWRTSNAPAISTISVDYAAMERSRNVAVVLADMRWSDLGSWNEIWIRAPRDTDGNSLQGMR